MAPRKHDEARNAANLRTTADERTIHEPASDEDEFDGRPSGELSEGDHDILESEDERERLLTQKDGLSGMFSRTGLGVKIGKRSKKQEMKERRRGGNQESSALMYEMEEGIGASTSSLRRSEESDEQRLHALRLQAKARRKRVWRRLCIYLSIIITFGLLFFATYRLSYATRAAAAATLMSNGTSLFAPTTILISLDGFRADFLYRGLTPTLNQFVQEGISPKYMLPSFPSVTFPNHYTMATGMYPEAHGVVGNTFWDPNIEKEFYYTDPERSLQPHWWGGEPIWATAEKQKVRAAVHMWPGSEAHILHQEIAYVDKYNGSEILPRKVDRILGLLDLPGPQDIGANADTPRPQLIAAYVPDVDADGHRYGPNSTEIRKTIASADAMMGDILKGLHERNLTSIVNVVVVSDHGMASTDASRLIQLEDLIDPAELSHIDGWPLYGLRPKKPEDLHRLYNQAKAKNNPNVEIYLRDEDMPERYHFSKNERIAPLWIVPKTGWAIVTKDEYDVVEGQKKGDEYHPKGIHGYDHEHPLMRAIFVARGPAFPHRPGSRMDPFQNIELYNIICDSIGLTPAPNNGTLRLPLTPTGHHNDPEAPSNEVPNDPVSPSSSSMFPAWATMSAAFDSLSRIAASASNMEDTSPSVGEHVTRPTPPTVVSDPPPAEPSKTEESWWDWISHKADEIEDFVEDLVHNISGSGS